MDNKKSKKWYKKWWVWTLVILAATAAGVAIYLSTYDSLGGVDSSGTTSDSQPVEQSEQSDSSSSDETNGREVTLSDGTEVTIQDYKSYDLHEADTTWHGNEAEVTEVTINKTDPFEFDDNDKGQITANGVIDVKLNFAANIEVDSFLDQATISTDTGVQARVDYLDSTVPDSIDSGVTENVELIFPIKTLSSADSVKRLRLKFTMAPDSESGHGGDDWKNYDMTIPLK